MTTRLARAARYARRKARHSKDGPHHKCGWLGGNPRYNGRQGWTRSTRAKTNRAAI